MKKSLIVTGLVAILALGSCKEDEPKINPLVGDWELVEVEFTDLPSAFASFEGYTDINLYGETSYELEINDDNTYERTLRLPSQRLQDEGEWEFDGEELELDPEEDLGLPTDFTLTEDIEDDELYLSAYINFRLLPDAVTDTATVSTQEELEALFENYGQTVEVNVIHLFEK
ncbi:MAG: hypothetical protein JXR10_03030 [Cyclobacteriaceae bacterium]